MKTRLWIWWYGRKGINSIKMMGFISYRQSWANGVMLPAWHPLRMELPCPVTPQARVAFEKVLRRVGW